MGDSGGISAKEFASGQEVDMVVSQNRGPNTDIEILRSFVLGPPRGPKPKTLMYGNSNLDF